MSPVMNRSNRLRGQTRDRRDPEDASRIMAAAVGVSPYSDTSRDSIDLKLRTHGEDAGLLAAR